MTTTIRSRLAYFTTAGLLIAYLVTTASGYHDYAGWILAAALFTLAMAFRLNPVRKSYAFTLMILAAASLAMYYPQHFNTVAGIKLSVLIVPLMQIIMFGMGTGLSVGDFARVAKMPKAVVIGVVCQYLIMPFVGLSLAKLFAFPNEVAAGIILIGSCPGGLASNVMTYLARANLALSVTLTAISTLIAPIVTPFLMSTLASEYVTMDFWKMFMDIVKIVLLPIGAGLIFNYFLKGRFGWLDRIMPLLSMAGIALIIVVITAAGRDQLLVVGPVLLLAVIIHNVSGYVFGYFGARIFGLKEEDRRTVAIEVGLQNAGLGSSLALGMGKIATVGLAAAVFAPVMNITGSVLASWWRHRIPEGALDEEPRPESARAEA